RNIRSPAHADRLGFWPRNCIHDDLPACPLSSVEARPGRALVSLPTGFESPGKIESKRRNGWGAGLTYVIREAWELHSTQLNVADPVPIGCAKGERQQISQDGDCNAGADEVARRKSSGAVADHALRRIDRQNEAVADD